jgi:arylsulfatase
MNRPNIVLIALDTQRADHLGCYGYPKATSPVH